MVGWLHEFWARGEAGYDGQIAGRAKLLTHDDLEAE